jgi:IS5 family transposase
LTTPPAPPPVPIPSTTAAVRRVAAAAWRGERNTAKARDPEMHQTKKGDQWYFGMKAHLGVDIVNEHHGHQEQEAAKLADDDDVAEVHRRVS